MLRIGAEPPHRLIANRFLARFLNKRAIPGQDGGLKNSDLGRVHATESCHASSQPPFGLSLSSHPEGGYEKIAQARDLAAILDELGIQKVDLVTHDIGNMVGYAFAALYQDRATKWVAMDAPLPGIGHWDDQLKNPKVWHFNFRGPDTERLVAGRERILLDRFYNELSANPAGIDEQTRSHYAALYARPGAIHNAFSGQFAAFAEDAIDNQRLLTKGKLTLPVLAIGGDHSYGAGLATEIGVAAADVRSAVITNSGHWIMEEQPEQAVAVILDFLEGK